MTRKSILTLGSSALLSLALLGGAATIASAEQHGSTDLAEAQAFLAAPGSIADAIKAAEAQTGGKAMSAEFESDVANAGMYKVEVAMPDGTTSTAIVNPADGSVKMMDPSMSDDDGANGIETGENDDQDGDSN